jgi:hypothetical protein
MLTIFLNLWYAMPPAVRWLVMLGPLAIGAIVSLIAWDWPYVAAGSIISFLLWLLPGANNAEKKGYHF